MLVPFKDQQSSLVVEMIDDTDITLGIYWHSKSFPGLSDTSIPGKIIIDGQPSLELTGRFLRDDYLRFSARSIGLLKHLFTAGSQGRIEYADDAWATFGLYGTSKAVTKLHYCWLQLKQHGNGASIQTAPAIGSPVVDSDTENGAKMKTYASYDKSGKHATLDVSACSEDEAPECISYSLSCSKDLGLSFFISGDENPDHVIEIVSGVARRKYDDARLDVLLSGGKLKVGMQIWSASLNYSDMNAWWDATIKSSDTKNFYEALMSDDPLSFTLTLLGNTYEFPKITGSSLRMSGFASTCKE